MDHYSEYPGVEEGIERRLEFPKINWLIKSKFEKLQTHNSITIHPFITNKHAKSSKTKKIFVGKSIPDNQTAINRLGNLPHTCYELIGSVFYSTERETWTLRVTHNGNTFDMEENFLVLYIKDPQSFYWTSNVKDQINSFIFNNSDTAKYALRAAVDMSDCKYNLIGRTIEEKVDSAKRPKYYSNGWYHFDEPIAQTFGKINKSYRLMFAPLESLELGFDQYETLCLKASPAGLKTLCRSAIRSYANYSQMNIKSLNNLERQLLPDTLVNYLKYPAYLNVGEYMLQNEKLVHEDDEYEFAFDTSTGHFICRSLNNTSVIENTDSLKAIIARNTDQIWLHRFQAVFTNQINSVVNSVHSNKNLDNYKFGIDWKAKRYKIESSCQFRHL